MVRKGSRVQIPRVAPARFVLQLTLKITILSSSFRTKPRFLNSQNFIHLFFYIEYG